MEEWLLSVFDADTGKIDFEKVDAEHLVPLNVTVECGRCHGSTCLKGTQRDYRRGIVLVLSDPAKYLFESEYLACWLCMTSMMTLLQPPRRYKIFERHYNLVLVASTAILTKETIKPRFMRETFMDGLSIYNPRHNYFMTLELDKKAMSCFQKRAECPELYDPHRVYYVTLFALLLCHLKDSEKRINSV